MTGEIDLNEECQTKHDTYFIRPCQVGLAKQYARSWGNDDGRHELTEIKGSRQQGHNRGGRVLAALDACDGVQIRHAYAIGYSYEYRAKNQHSHTITNAISPSR